MSPRNVILGTAGHIDHGKTALVRALTGVDTDRLPEEKRRGITIDLGFAALDLHDVHVALIDVPGHERFIRNMLAGTTAIDMALLVIAADDSVMPQTREHFDILRLLGLRTGAIALTKCDLVDSSWLDLVEAEIRELVRDSFLSTAPIVRTSVHTGLGIDALRDEIHSLALAAPARADVGYFRLSIDRAFALEGRGTVATGTVASGHARVGDELQLWPQGVAVRVRGLQRHDQKVDIVGPGERAALNLAGVHHTDVRRGCELATPGFLEPSRVLTVELRASAETTSPLRHRQRYRLHIGTTETSARLLLHDGAEVPAGAASLGQLVSQVPVASVFGQPFVLRDDSAQHTLGGGLVVEPTTRRKRRRELAAVASSGTPLERDAARRIEAAYERARLAPLAEPAISRETGLTPIEIASATAQLKAQGRLVELSVGHRRVSWLPRALVRELESRVINTLARRHAARPRASFIPRQELASALADLGSEALISSIIERLREQNAVIVEGRSLALKSHKPKLSQAELRLKKQVCQAIVSGAFSPPTADELTSTLRAQPEVVLDLLRLLADEGLIIEIGPGLWMGTECEAEMRRRVVERLSPPGAGGMTMAELRDALATTRKFAVPYGEYLDRLGLTCREGEVRRLVVSALSSNVEMMAPTS